MLCDNVRERLAQDEHATLALLRYSLDGHIIHAGAHEDIVVYRQKAGRCELISTSGLWVRITRELPPDPPLKGNSNWNAGIYWSCMGMASSRPWTASATSSGASACVRSSKTYPMNPLPELRGHQPICTGSHVQAIGRLDLAGGSLCRKLAELGHIAWTYG